MHGVPSKEGAEHQDVGVFFIAGPLWRGLREHESVAEAVSWFQAWDSVGAGPFSLTPPGPFGRDLRGLCSPQCPALCEQEAQAWFRAGSRSGT